MRKKIFYSACCGFLGFILLMPSHSVFASCQTDYTECAKNAGKLDNPAAQAASLENCQTNLNTCSDSVKKEKDGGGNPSVGNYGLDDTAGAAGLKKSGTVAGITGSIVGVVLSLVGIAFFLLMLYGGFLWMTARGDETQAKKAKDIIIDAVIGIIIVAAAGIITSFVFGNVVPK